MAAVLACVTLAGCGGGGGDDAPAEALKSYFDAMAEKDWKRACDLLSDRGTKGIWESEGGCEKPLAGYRPEGVPPTVRKAMEDGDYTVEIQGDQATVTPEGTGAYSLVREDGEWLLAQPS